MRQYTSRTSTVPNQMLYKLSGSLHKQNGQIYIASFEGSSSCCLCFARLEGKCFADFIPSQRSLTLVRDPLWLYVSTSVSHNGQTLGDSLLDNLRRTRGCSAKHHDSLRPHLAISLPTEVGGAKQARTSMPLTASGDLPVPQRTNTAMFAMRLTDASAKEFRFVYCLTARWSSMDVAGTLAWSFVLLRFGMTKKLWGVHRLYEVAINTMTS